jgi:hypothetical protein
MGATELARAGSASDVSAEFEATEIPLLFGIVSNAGSETDVRFEFAEIVI